MIFVSAGVDGAMSAIVNHGPLAVALYTGNDFFAYNSGMIFSDRMILSDF
jgi:hypothetical protein